MDLLKIPYHHIAHHIVYHVCVFVLLATLSTLVACADRPAPRTARTPLAPLRVLPAENGALNGQSTEIYPVQGLYAGYFVPDGKGGVIWIGSNDLIKMPDASLEDAREFSLQLHELGDQLLGDLFFHIDDDTMSEDIMVITSMPFVNMKDSTKTCSLGRYIGEQMVCECNRHGLTTRGCPMENTSSHDKNSSEPLPAEQKAIEPSTDYATHIITGTYYDDKKTLVLNARLIDRSTGNIISTGLQVLNKTPFLLSLLAEQSQQIKQVDIPIREFTLQ